MDSGPTLQPMGWGGAQGVHHNCVCTARGTFVQWLTQAPYSNLRQLMPRLDQLEVPLSLAADCVWLISHGDHGSSAYHAGSVSINFRLAHIGNLQAIANHLIQQSIACIHPVMQCLFFCLCLIVCHVWAESIPCLVYRLAQNKPAWQQLIAIVHSWPAPNPDANV